MVFIIYVYLIIYHVIEPACHAWSFDKTQNLCYLKSKFKGIFEYDRNYDSGVLDEIYEDGFYIQKTNVDCYYIDDDWMCIRWAVKSGSISDDKTEAKCETNKGNLDLLLNI